MGVSHPKSGYLSDGVPKIILHGAHPKSLGNKKETKMKRTNRLIALTLLIALFALIFTSCDTGNVAERGTATVVIEERDGSFTTYGVDLSLIENRSEGALSLLEYLASIEGSTLYYNAQWGGGYGAFLTSIGSLTPEGNEFVSVYTSEECDFATPTEWAPVVPSVVFEGKTIYSSGLGISSMTVKDGTVILFRIDTY
jgi:hypothetical protein